MNRWKTFTGTALSSFRKFLFWLPINRYHQSGANTIKLVFMNNKKTTPFRVAFFMVEMPGIGPGSGETLGYKCLVRDSAFLLDPGKL